MPFFSLKDIEFFYLALMVLVAFAGSLLSFNFWKANSDLKTKIYSNCALYISLVILTLGLPSFVRLISIGFPSALSSLELKSSLYKIISLFNNLFILLVAKELPVERRRFTKTTVLNLFILFVSLNILLLFIDKLSFNGYPVGNIIVVLLDSLVSVLCIILLGRSIMSFLKEKVNVAGVVINFFMSSIALLCILILISASLFILKTNFPDLALPTYVRFFSLLFYFFSISILIVVLLFVNYFLLIRADSIQLSTKFNDKELLGDINVDVINEGDTLVESNMEILPKHILIDFDSSKSVFTICLTGGANNKEYIWQGESCNYPFFYWIYLAVAVEFDLKAEIKNAQVMRNKMVQLISRDLKPKNIITLVGDLSSLNLSKHQIEIKPSVFSNRLVKAKFRTMADVLLPLIEYDVEKYKRDRMYSEFVFLQIFEKIASKYTQR